MKTLLPAVAAALALAAVRTAPPQDDPADEAALVERGRYLVHHVAMCIECHTPRDEGGQLVREKLLHGAPIPVGPPRYPTMAWAFASAHIAGLPGYTDEQAVRLLTTGIAARGGSPRPPMPPFRMTEEDAAAVVAYLRSIE